MKLSLGTVQFGLNYGISNTSGQVPLAKITELLNLAEHSGITYLDTAHHYGESEKNLGLALDPMSRLKVVSKTPRFEQTEVSAGDAILLKSAADNSLQLLKRNSLDGLLFHSGKDLLKTNGSVLWKAASELRDAGVTRKIGVSVYDVEELQAIADRFDIELIQIPGNLFDQRFLQAPVLRQLKERGVEIHCRSAFLQGLVFRDPSSLSPHFANVKKPLADFQSQCKQMDIPIARACLSFLLCQPLLDQVVVGVTNANELTELLTFAREPAVNLDFASFSIDDRTILNPSMWKS